MVERMIADTPEDMAPEEWVSMAEAQRLTGMSRIALQQRKNRGMLEARVVSVSLQSRGRRVFFKRSQLPIKEER